MDRSPSPQADEPQAPAAGSPSDFLKNIVGKKVRVRIGSGVDYHGEYRWTAQVDSRKRLAGEGIRGCRRTVLALS